jgi:hypothetical protein
VVALAAAVVAVAGVGLRRRWRRAWETWPDPSVDPGVGDHRTLMELEQTTELLDRVRRSLDASDGDAPWRAPLRPVLARTVELAELAPGLLAEALARAGHRDAANTLAAALPPDDPAACWVRHWEYRAARDGERAEAALVAAVSLAGPADRPRYAAALARWRRDHPRSLTEAERLWDPDGQNPHDVGRAGG